jgi:FG-GAP-like repeat
MVFNVLNPRPDFNGDGKTDVFWRNDATNQNAVWLMNGTQLQRASFLPNVAEEAGWRETKLGDFNGDGKTDIFWRNAATGQNAIWLMDGDRIASAQFITGTDRNWQADIGDFNGDGKSDFFWHNKVTGQTAAWLMNSFTIQDGRFLPNVPPEWESFVAEFNRDGKTDLFWRNSRTGDNAVWTMNGAQLGTGQFIRRQDAGWAPTLVDLDTDGRSDVLWNNRDGRNALWFWSTTSLNPESNQVNLPNSSARTGNFLDPYIRNYETVLGNFLLVVDPIASTGKIWSFIDRQLQDSAIPLGSNGATGLRSGNFQLGDFDGDGFSDYFGTVIPGVARLAQAGNGGRPVPELGFVIVSLSSSETATQLPGVDPLQWRPIINFV